MPPLELKTALGIPLDTPGRRINPVTLRLLCAGGAEILDLKNWATGISQDSVDPKSAKLGHLCLLRVAAIEFAMLSAVEKSKNLPRGALTDHL